MADIILLTFFLLVFYAGIRCGSAYGGLLGTWKAASGWAEKYLGSRK